MRQAKRRDWEKKGEKGNETKGQRKTQVRKKSQKTEYRTQGGLKEYPVHQLSSVCPVYACYEEDLSICSKHHSHLIETIVCRTRKLETSQEETGDQCIMS